MAYQLPAHMRWLHGINVQQPNKGTILKALQSNHCNSLKMN